MWEKCQSGSDKFLDLPSTCITVSSLSPSCIYFLTRICYIIWGTQHTKKCKAPCSKSITNFCRILNQAWGPSKCSDSGQLHRLYSRSWPCFEHLQHLVPWFLLEYCLYRQNNIQRALLVMNIFRVRNKLVEDRETSNPKLVWSSRHDIIRVLIKWKWGSGLA